MLRIIKRFNRAIFYNWHDLIIGTLSRRAWCANYRGSTAHGIFRFEIGQSIFFVNSSDPIDSALKIEYCRNFFLHLPARIDKQLTRKSNCSVMQSDQLQNGTRKNLPNKAIQPVHRDPVSDKVYGSNSAATGTYE